MNIVVRGMGIICAIGNNAQEVLESLRKKQSGVGPMKYLQSSHKELPVGEVKLSDDEMKEMLGLDKNAIVSRTALMGAISLKQAIADSNIDLKGKRVAVISGTTVGGMDVTERYFQQMKTDDALLSLLAKHDCGSSTREIADLAGLNDTEVITISTACSSAVNSIILGSEMLKNDEVDVVFAGGAEGLSKFHLNGFNTLMILDHEQCRPFDSTRKGLNLGEGAAYVVLAPQPLKAPQPPKVKAPQPPKGEAIQSEGNEKTCSEKPCACPPRSCSASDQRSMTGAGGLLITGYSNRCDAFHQTASSDDGEGAYLAMCDALKMADLKPEDIQYINAHGTGTPNNDKSESASIRRVFGDKLPLVSSTKGFTGHTTSASGSIETVICLLAMQNNFVPGNWGWSTQDDDCITPTQGVENMQLDNVICNSFGFGGNDSSLIISKNITSSEAKLHDDLPQTSLCFASNFMMFSEEVIDDVEQLKDFREFITPMEARRMGKLLKASTLTSMRALKTAGIECPDAIITATANGMLETTEKFLEDIDANGEELLKPTLFMQSTHNTLGSAIAIRTKCHGYNITYTQGEQSFDLAIRDAKRLIMTGKANSVLVGYHDEATPLFQSFCERMGKKVPGMIYSKSVVLMKK